MKSFFETGGLRFGDEEGDDLRSSKFPEEWGIDSSIDSDISSDPS